MESDTDLRESAFDTLNDSTANPIKKVYVIPPKYSSKIEVSNGVATIPSFKFNIPKKCFEDCGRKPIQSLFFKMLESEKLKDMGFFVINFSEQQVGDTILERDSLIENILRVGIHFAGNLYNVVGCSNSQVQKKSFFFMKGEREDCDQIIQRFIPQIKSLEQKKGVAKRVKYAGLLFSGCQQIFRLPVDCSVFSIPDYNSGKYNFTDGCGLISLKLAQMIVEDNESLKKTWKDNIPSVWQIRFYGIGYLCKGVVIVDFSETNKSVLSLRHSMIKVDVPRLKNDKNEEINWLGIIETSINKKMGSLNKQVVTLLSSAVPKDELIQVQEDYINGVLNSRFNAIQALKIGAMTSQSSSMKSLLKKQAVTVLPKNYTSLVGNIESHFVKKSTKTDMEGFVNDRIHIPLASSRLLFGAAFPEKLNLYLKEGQCIVFKEIGYHEGLVIVNRSPSYAPGDIRVLEAVKPPSTDNCFRKMSNVILFATQGNRPDPDKMSGGDLDGDKYLVIWDQRLLQYADQIRSEEPIDFSQPEYSDNNSRNSGDWVSYTAKWENSLLGQIDNCFYNLAELYGVKSDQCKEICIIFSRVVDQVPADIKRLESIARYYGFTPKRYHCFASTPENRQPVWERMRHNIIETLGQLKRREKFPQADWERFYDSLIYQDQGDIKALFSSSLVQELLNKEQIDKIKVLWERMCEGKRKMIQQPTQSIDCIYDCSFSECKNEHGSDPAVFKQNWKGECQDVILSLFKDKMEEFEKVKLEIDEHQKKLFEKNRMEKEAELEFEKQLTCIEKKKTTITQVISTFSKIDKIFQQLSKPVSISQKLTSWLNINNINNNITALEKDITILYNKILLEVNDMNYEFGMPKILVVKFDSADHFFSNVYSTKYETTGTYYEVFKNQTMKAVELAKTKLKEMSPNIEVVPSCIENIDKMMAVFNGIIAEKQFDKQKIEKEVQNIETKIVDCDTKLSKIHSDISKQKRVKEILRELKNEHLLTQPVRISEVIINAIVDPDLLGGYQRCHEITNHCFDRGFSEKMIKDIRDICISREERINKSISYSNLQKVKLQTEIDDFKKERESHLKFINKLKLEISHQNREVTSYQKLRLEVYDERQHLKAIEKYHEIDIQQLKSFDLALCALYHEIDYQFDVKKVTNDQRVASNKALKLSLRREKNRCERDLTEHALPVFRKRAEILDSLRNHDAVIVVAQTGSGKSTQVPQYLADDLHHVLSIDGNFPKVACTQPRRVACIRIAERVAFEYSGAVDLPAPKDKEERTEQVMGRRRVAAYPLYASLAERDQDRALESEDRVGFDVSRPHCRKKKNNIEKTTQKVDELKGTPGEIGKWIGYQIGSKGKSKEERINSKRFCKDTRVHFVTEGLLLQKIKRSEGNQTPYNCIIVDEAHERGRDTDLLLAHLYEIMNSREGKAYTGRNLKIVVMSASIDKEAFSRYFGGCPIVECNGRMHHVQITYLPPPKDGGRSEDQDKNNNDDEDSDYDSSWESDESINKGKKVETKLTHKRPSEMSDLIKHAVDTIFNVILNDKEPGDILVFLPGQNEIHKCVDMINKKADDLENKLLDQLHPTKKVVCCTNIAETSLTIPGIKYVLDAGKAKKIKYNHRFRVTALKLCNISQASAEQRKGRAGRVAPGHCYRLYSKGHHDKRMDSFDEPEMKQAPIDELYLYALDVLKGLEKIVLMDDAKIEPEIISHAKRRLMNLEYITEDKSDDDEAKITDEGEFALSLSGDVTLEGSKMILEARQYGVVYDALYLAVLLSENIYDKDNENKEEQAKYIDELGDHLTILNLYKHFDINFHQCKKTARQWCEKVGLNAVILEQASKSASRVYESIKRENKFDIADIFIEQKNEYRKEQKKNHKKIVKIVGGNKKCLIGNDKREGLMKAVVAGYFHNIAFLNDPKFIGAGFSLATPENYGDAFGVNFWHQANLLKLKLSKESSLNVLGDVLKNEISIYGTLFETSSGLILMKTVSRVKANWITECSSQRWRDSIYLDSADYNKYVKRNILTKIGPVILSELKKMRDVKYINWLQDETNAKIELFFESGELRIYGSNKEVRLATAEINDRLDDLKALTIEADEKERFPKSSNIETQYCIIESGLKIKESSNLPRPQIFHDVDEITSTTLILHNSLGSEENVREAIKIGRDHLPHHLQTVWEDAYLHYNEKKDLARISFARKDVANIFFTHFKNYFPNKTKCFFDKNVQLNVLNVDLYPSVKEIAGNYQYIDVKAQNNNRFKIEQKKGCPRNEINYFLERLADKQVFGTELIEDIDAMEIGVREYVFWKISNGRTQVEHDYNVIIKDKKHPKMTIEIFGEFSNRRKAADLIRQKIDDIKNDLASSHAKTYNKKIKLGKRHQLGIILEKIKELRDTHQKVKIKLEFGNVGSAFIPVVHLICDSASDGRAAKKAVQKYLDSREADEIVSEPRCCMCDTKVYLRKSSQQKKQEKAELKAARDEKGSTGMVRLKDENEDNLPRGIRLVLCGDTFCLRCLETHVKENLKRQLIAKKHSTVYCYNCDNIILIKDIKVFYDNIKTNIFKMVFKSYLYASLTQSKLQIKHVDECGKCRALLILYQSDYGVYRCSNKECRYLYCCQCHKRVMQSNKVELENHFNEQCLTNNMYQYE